MAKLEFSQSLDDRGWVYAAVVDGKQVAFDLRDHDRVAFLEGILAAVGVESNLRRMDLPDGKEKFFRKGKKVGERLLKPETTNNKSSARRSLEKGNEDV